jgi:hypothetical protein
MNEEEKKLLAELKMLRRTRQKIMLAKKTLNTKKKEFGSKGWIDNNKGFYCDLISKDPKSFPLLLEAKIDLPFHDKQFATYLLQHATTPETLQMLVGCGLDIKETNNDWTNIYHAIGLNNQYKNPKTFLPMCDALLALGAEVDAGIWFGSNSTTPRESSHHSYTPLMYIVSMTEGNADVELIKWFLKASASPSIRNSKQESALSIARSKKLHDIVKMLEQADCK